MPPATQIQSLSKYELLLVNTAIYWGEGRKRWPQNDQHVQFVNSDPNMVALFLRFLRKIIQVPEERLKVSIRIHPNISKESAINSWNQITNIPRGYFHVIRQINRLSRGKRPRNSLPYGTLELRINSRQKSYQIKGWIEGLIRQAI